MIGALPKPYLSPATNVLVGLLSQARRTKIAAVLHGFDDANAALLDGRVAAQLGLRQPPARATPPVKDWVVGLFDEQYPWLLAEIPDPPLVLYLRGNVSLLHQDSIAVVGARRCTHAGRDFATSVARNIANNGLVVVSGLALGIDGAAHRGVLASLQPHNTIAVLGSGFAHLYPAAHKSLAREIVDAGGLLVSEWPADAGVRAHQFPERNRLISGLAAATLVVEAGAKSGSLITARLALEQGRDVLAVPGPVASQVSAGCHRLIQQGAGLATCAEDVFAAIGFAAVSAPDELQNLSLSEAQIAVLNLMQGYPLTLDELVHMTGLPAAELSALLVSLEVVGIVEQGALGYIRTSDFLSKE